MSWENSEDHIAELQKRIEADPRVNPWGIRTCDMFLGGCGGFYWYESEEALRNSLVRGDHALELGATKWTDLQPLIESALNDIERIEPDSACGFHDVTCEVFGVEWWGKFEELCSGDSEIAVMVRRDFLEAAREDEDEDDDEDVEQEDEDDESAPRPLLPSEVDDFVQYLREWGF